MNNQQLALLLTGYHRALDEGLDQVAERIPEYKVMAKDFLKIEHATYPVLDPIHSVLNSLSIDIERLETATGEPIVESPESEKPQPKKGKEFITFEGDHIDVNNVSLGVHDLLMYARSILRKEAGKDVEVACLKVALEDVIELNQGIRGDGVGARMPSLINGEEV